MANYLDKSGLLRVLKGVKNQIERKVGELETTKGRPNGIASLDSKGFVPLDQLGNLDRTIYEPVQELPTKDIKKHIYLIKNNKEGKQDTYDEFIYTGDVDGEYDASKWEKLGDFVPTFDLKEYAKKGEVVSSMKFSQEKEGCRIIYTLADGNTEEAVIPLASAKYELLFPIEPDITTRSKPAGRWVYRDGVMSGGDKYKLDQIDTTALSQSIYNANTAADNTNEAIRKCETATAGAEKCNVTLEGTKIIVTNRNGEVKETEVVDTEEVVTVVITSSVESIKVSGIKINVFLNNGNTPQTYTTNAEGKATFTVDRGNYYQVTFPEYGNAQPIAPQGYTAVLADRNINVEYLPYDEDDMEKVVITATKYVEDVGTAWEGIPVIVTVDKKATTYQTDEKGQVTVFVPYKKEYTVNIDDQDGYNVSFNKSSRTYTANVPQRLIDYRFYQFKAGIFVVDANKNEYYIEDWVAAGKNADDAVAIKVADASLSINHGTFCIRTSDIKNVSKLPIMEWCTQKLNFNSIASNGNNVNDANYYNGESSSFLIRQEAQERSLSVPAFDYAYEQVFSIGGEDLHGFIMSVGQEYVHVANIGIIRQVLETLYGEEVATNYYNFVINYYRWTSVQYDTENAYRFSVYPSDVMKDMSNKILPVFAC
nr:hypothetical protein [Prevotella sp.]